MTRDALKALYVQYGHLVLRRCERILRNRALAEELTQDVFLRVMDSEEAFQQVESKLGWLYRVAERCCFNVLNRQRRVVWTSLESPQVRHPSFHSSVEERDLVLHFLGELDDRVKQIAVLHFLDGMTQEEIAHEVGWSRQTVFKKLLQIKERAQTLRTQLSGEGLA